MPGPAAVAALDAAFEKTLDERAVRVARRRVHDHAGRLVDHEQPLVLVDDAQRHLFVLSCEGSGAGASNSTVSPACSTWCFAAGRPSTSAAPASMARAAAEREHRRRGARRRRRGARRGPRRPRSGACRAGGPGLKRGRHGTPAGRRAGPRHDGDVGDVEGGPPARGDEVEDRPVEAQAVDEVPDGAAEHDGDRVPVARRRQHEGRGQGDAEQADERDDRPAGVAEPAERDAAVHRDLEAHAGERGRTAGSPRRGAPATC